MNWLDKIERKIGRYAIPNLTVYLLICYGIGFVIRYTIPTLLLYLTLEPAYILQGQVWRVITWIVVPPNVNPLFIIFVFLLYYSLGRILESAWGAFRYNIYLFSGMIFTLIGAFIVYALTGASGIGTHFGTLYINMSIFLACATLMPDLKMYLYGLIPVKMKWLAYLDVLLLAVNMYYGDASVRIAIIASLLNFIIYFFANRKKGPNNVKQVVRRQKYRKAALRPVSSYEGGAVHKCCVCGRTELSDPTLEFRYCSKCSGNREYCQDHLFTHEHVK